MRFSVIIPVYNVEAYLEQCVDSVLNQSFRDFELILVDDGSPDSCPMICDTYAQRDERVTVVHQKNGGLSAARNTGIRTAKGEYLLFVDSDDYWNSSLVLEKINGILDEHEVEIVQFGLECFDSKRNQIVSGPPRTLTKYNGLAPDEMLSRLVTDGKLKISACVIAISRTLIVENNLFFEKGIKSEDIEWAIRVYLHEPRWAFIDEYFYVYRKARDGSITSTIDYRHLCDYCWILEQSVRRVENAQESIRKPLMSYLMYQALIACAHAYRVNLPGNQRREIIGRIHVVCKGRIGQYTMNKKVRFASLVYRMAGFGCMARFLGFYLKNRGR